MREPMPDSPLLDLLELADHFARRFPEDAHKVIREEMWQALGYAYARYGGCHVQDGEPHILAPLGPVRCICPMREMGLLC